MQHARPKKEARAPFSRRRSRLKAEVYDVITILLTTSEEPSPIKIYAALYYSELV